MTMSSVAVFSTGHRIFKETPNFLFLLSFFLAAVLFVPSLFFVLSILFFLILVHFFRRFFILIVPKWEHVLSLASPRSPPF